MKPTTDKKAEAERIIKAAREHIFKHGFRSLSLDKLAKKLGIPVKTVYAHFHTKPLLIMAALSDKMDEVDREQQAIHARKDITFAEHMQMVNDMVHRHSLEYSPNFVRDLTNTPALHKWAHNLRSEILRDGIAQTFKLGQREGTIRDDIHAELFSDIYLTLTDGVLIGSTLKKDKDTDLPETIKRLLTVLLKGALVRCGEESVRDQPKAKKTRGRK